MKRISTAVLVAALLAGTATVIATPAIAKDKKEETKSGPTPQFGAAVEKAKAALAANDDAGANAAITEVEGMAKSDQERFYGQFLRLALVQKQVVAASKTTNGVYDPRPMLPLLDGLLANPATPATQIPMLAVERGRAAYAVKDWATATTMFNKARDAGSTDTDLWLFIVDTRVHAGDVAGALAEFDKQLAAGKPMTEDQYRFAAGHALTANLRPDTLKWIKLWVTAYPTAKTWHDVAQIYGMAQNSLAKLDKKQSIDLFRLLRQNKALADQNEYEAYAQRVFDVGLPEETKAVIAEGKASGKIPASSPNSQALVNSAQAQSSSDATLAGLATKAAAAANGALASQTGDAYLGRGDYAKAAELYRLALQKGGVNNDEVNTHLGIALALSGDKAGARTAFTAVTTAPRSELAGLWIVWLDHPAVG